MNITIRQENANDRDEVYNVVKSSFENEEFSDKDEHNLVNRLRKSTAFIPELSLVAECENKIVGHILFTKIKVGDARLLALAPISVLPEMQGKGIGKQLITEGHKRASQLGYKGCVVLGHDKYYPKLGYLRASQYHIEAPFEVPDECFMAIEFEEGSLAGVQGVVEYAQEFFES